MMSASVGAQTRTDTVLRRRRASLLVLMLVVGLGMASWVTRTPAVRDAVDGSTAEMGLILFGLSIGSMIGVVASGPLVRRLGTRPIVLTGTVLVIAGVSAVAVATAIPSAVGVFLGLFLFGLGGGLGEIGLNVDGAAVEKLLGRPLLPMLHGFFSLGTVIGAVVGIAMTAIGLPVIWHLLAVVVVLTACLLWAAAGIPGGTGRRGGSARRASDASAVRPSSVWRERAVLLIGVIVLAMAFAEGSANDWLPLLMVDGHGVSATWGALVYTGFAAMMTIGRFAGGPIVERVGRRPVLLVSAVMAIIGVLAVAYAPHMIVAVIAVVLWGLGASLGFPVAISAAGDSADRAAERVSAVATSGYLAFLVGPPLLGFVGEHWGLQNAMLIVVALLAIAVGAVIAMGPTSPVSGAPPVESGPARCGA
ncbi:MFS transporter [Microbacterium hibisci]|uniref:MFS transporter n=1 Tax=Microbacterium hibisci TaxID=2036000 RepID=UPI001EF1B115|nr:MFS transporter [Microbacterium hibisci]